jgi:hypothetical protein
MIDTCDSQVACWSDDGETFIVKDPAKFERTIIPQFFKHSKFSSFVRVSYQPQRESYGCGSKVQWNGVEFTGVVWLGVT